MLIAWICSMCGLREGYAAGPSGLSPSVAMKVTMVSGPAKLMAPLFPIESAQTEVLIAVKRVVMTRVIHVEVFLEALRLKNHSDILACSETYMAHVCLPGTCGTQQPRFISTSFPIVERRS